MEVHYTLVSPNTSSLLLRTIAASQDKTLPLEAITALVPFTDSQVLNSIASSLVGHQDYYFKDICIMCMIKRHNPTC